MQAIPDILQLFALFKAGDLVLLELKIVANFLLTGTDHHLRKFIQSFNNNFTPGDVIHGPGVLRSHGMIILQDEDLSVSIRADDMLERLEANPISRIIRRQCDDKMNDVQKNAFMSINDSIGWLETNVYQLCAFYFSPLQQEIPPAMRQQ